MTDMFETDLPDTVPAPGTAAARWERQARHFESRVHFNRTCRLRVEQWTDDGVVMSMPHAEILCNSTNGFHGGVIASLADTCGTAAALAAVGADGFIATVSMNISYLAAATTDVTATGVCIKPGKRIQVSEVRIRDTSGTLVAEAIITSALPG
jgi:uncharacterized protein (TIGR00369 family)